MDILKYCYMPGKSGLLPAFVLLLTACKGPYTVTLNDRVLYTPNPDASEKLLSDPNLQGCLNQILLSSTNKDPQAVTLMACPNAGIQSLRGIENLPNMEQLDLSDNAINDLGPLVNLKKLRVLSLRNNGIRNISQLSSLPILRFVSLQGNDDIPCRQLDNLAKKVGSSLNRPSNCLYLRHTAVKTKLRINRSDQPFLHGSKKFNPLPDVRIAIQPRKVDIISEMP